MPDRSMEIVLVENDASLRLAMQRMLQAAGCTVTTYSSAEDLMDVGIDEAKQCDCLVLDICLPGISGIDLCRTLQKSGTLPPCILITGHDSPGQRDIAIRAGASDYLLKPFTGTSLLDAIMRTVAV
ncbi:response regulator [uncultured Marinobacter sp.]|uniref:response regulator transcription factor n=1 Tax=uncultured Marinobacter sp. TaxID=187379 RepID=UPI002617D8CF|nr:response regulator [uncultured Marinobacter sp.]